MRLSVIHPRLLDAGAVALSLFAAYLALEVDPPVLPTEAPAWRWVDIVLGVAASLMVPARRRFPVGIAAVVWALNVVAVTPWGASFVVTFGLAVRRPWPVAVGVGLASLAAVPLTGLFRRQTPEAALSWTSFGWVTLITALLLASGMVVRARHELMESLVDRAERAEAEAALRADAARTGERTRIAREMHDVLAHRLSLVSMHAGALAHRHHPSPQEVADALEVIRSGARDALVDLRTILGVLRDPVSGAVGAETAEHAPQPTLDDLDRLLEGMRATGTTVRLHDERDAGGSLPDDCGRTLYRITQEALTNAARHAPGQPVDITLRGAPGGDAELLVSNPIARGRAAEDGAGAGAGLVGIAERVGLAGGRVLARGPDADRFRVAVSIPWPVAP